MLKETEKATVVIVNPTHFAIAVQYLPNMRAPIVIAKGRDHLAQKIKESHAGKTFQSWKTRHWRRLCKNG